MKHLTTILAAVVIIVGLVGTGLNIYYAIAISNNQDYIGKTDYRGHSYVLVHANGSTGITHDPDCPCHKEGGEE